MGTCFLAFESLGGKFLAGSFCCSLQVVVSANSFVIELAVSGSALAPAHWLTPFHSLSHTNFLYT